jgi:hypothetical protein
MGSMSTAAVFPHDSRASSAATSPTSAKRTPGISGANGSW